MFNRVVRPGEFTEASLVDCPLCQPVPGDMPHVDGVVKCKRCGQFVIGSDLMIRIGSVPNRHLLGGYTRENWETTQKRAVLVDSNLEEIRTVP